MAEPSTRALVPRSLTVCACCPEAEDTARAAMHTALVRIQDATFIGFFLKRIMMGATLARRKIYILEQVFLNKKVLA